MLGTQKHILINCAYQNSKHMVAKTYFF